MNRSDLPVGDPDHTDRPGHDPDPAFAEYRRTGDRRLRNQLVEENRQVAEYFIKRYSHRGVPTDDLRQISLLAVIAAVERFDPSMGVAFSTFASRTIEGELKRYLRDRTWTVRPPRRAQELHLELRRADEELSQRLGRSPTIAELAEEVDASQDHVLEALEAGVAHQATSLDQPQGGGAPDEVRSVGDRVLVDNEDGFADIERRQVVTELLDGLPEREREVIRLRFFENMTQPEIAERMGVSQSYLSRIIRRTLVDLRDRLSEADALD
jgi:RNA polymerase sigma-B factor